MSDWNPNEIIPACVIVIVAVICGRGQSQSLIPIAGRLLQLQGTLLLLLLLVVVVVIVIFLSGSIYQSS